MATTPVDDTSDQPPADPAWEDEYWEDDWQDDDEFVYVPPEGGVGRKILAVAVCLAVFVFLVLGMGGWWMWTQLNGSGTKTAVTFTVPRDATNQQIANLLEDQRIIGDATIFRYYSRVKNLSGIKAGEYDGLYTNDSMDHVINRLKQGPSKPATVPYVEVTFPEGLWLSQSIATMKKAFPAMTDEDILAAFTKLQSTNHPADKSWDGFLFPAKYQVAETDQRDPAKLMQQMVTAFDRTADDLGLADASQKLAGVAGKRTITPYDALIVASLVEEEAKLPEDRPRIARVIYNRLLRGMKLEIDATVVFALGVPTETLTQSQLQTDSPYNTRRYAGLPPTPISSPGKASLEAALNPSTEAGSDQWLYYVLVDKDGRHFFTGNYDEFTAKANEARANGVFE